MAKDPAFLFYPGDWNLGTMHMTLLDKGAYIELLMLQFARDKFTLAQAKHMLGGSFDVVWANISEKFETDGNHYWNDRLCIEKEKRVKFTESRRDNALNPKKEDKHKQEHMPPHMEDENKDINKDINTPFISFWNLYDKKLGNKKGCEKKWNKLKESEREIIMKTLPIFTSQIKDKQFQPYPETYLNHRRWENEEVFSHDKEIPPDPYQSNLNPNFVQIKIIKAND